MREKKDTKFKKLKKRISYQNITIILLIISITCLLIINRVSHAGFTSGITVPLANGKINYKHPDFRVMEMYSQASQISSTYTEVETMPEPSKYTINEEKSYCNKGNSAEKDTEVVLKTVNGNHVMNNLTKNARCYLYFDMPIVVNFIANKGEVSFDQITIYVNNNEGRYLNSLEIPSVSPKVGYYNCEWDVSPTTTLIKKDTTFTSNCIAIPIPPNIP